MNQGIAERPITIGVDARFIQDKYHGIGRYTYQVLNHLCHLEGAHKVIAFVDPRLPNSRFPLESLLRSGKMAIHTVSMPLYHPVEWLAWRAVLRSQPVDVFHAPYFWSPLLLSCPLVTTIHDMIFDRYPAYMPERQFALIYRIVSRLAMRRARRVIAVSEATKQDIITFTRINGSKVCVVPEGVEASFHPIIDERVLQAVRTRYGLPECYVLALGARRPHKNIARLVEAFEQVADRVPHTLVLVGATDTRFESTASNNSVEELKRRGRLVEIGHVAEEDLPALYSMADLFVQPSIIEGFGLPVLEAMACDCPVICSNTSSLPEVAGNAAVLVDPTSTAEMAHAIQTVLLDSELQQRLALQGMRRASQFGWSAAATGTLSIYHDAVCS